MRSQATPSAALRERRARIEEGLRAPTISGSGESMGADDPFGLGVTGGSGAAGSEDNGEAEGEDTPKKANTEE